MPQPNLRSLLALIFLSKFCFFFLVFLGFHLLPFNTPAFNGNFVSSNHPVSNWVLPLATWDAQHYISLAEKGYAADGLSNNFFPLYPWLIKILHLIFRSHYLLAGLVLSNFLSFLMLGIFYLFVKKLFDPEIAFLSSLFMLAFPTGFYLNLVYTESLFLTLVLIFFYSLYEEKIFLAFLAAFLLPLVKAQGILVLLPLLIFLVFQKAEKQSTKRWFLIVAFLAGFITYLSFMKYKTGAFFSGFTMQNEYVSSNSISNIFNLKDWFLRNFIHITYTLHDFTTSIIDRLFFVGFVFLLWFIYMKLDKTLFYYALVMGVVPALMGSFMSYSRYLLIVFPLFIVLALLLRQKSYFVIVPMIVLQVLFSLMHCLNFWVA